MAQQALAHCRTIASFTDEPGVITRTFLSPATQDCHKYLSGWMDRLGMKVDVDAVGNVRGLYPGRDAGVKRLLIGSHLDTVPNAGMYDGVLGVVIGLELVEAFAGERLPFGIEVIGFSEEEGVRFGVPFIGSRALAGSLDEAMLSITDCAGLNMRQAIHGFGLDASRIQQTALTSTAGAYLEFHIEQGPVLESLDASLGVVTAIVGQSRAAVRFSGKANHAGTTPMHLRRDALCAAAEWITQIENEALASEGLVATVGRLDVKPGAANVVPGEVSVTLDVRHAQDGIRRVTFDRLLQAGAAIADRRGLDFSSVVLLDQAAVAMDETLTTMAEEAIWSTGSKPYRMPSGAGHDAMVLARMLPSTMVFIRSPGGISHHPDELVRADDVEAALQAGFQLLQNLSTCRYLI